MKYGIVYLLAFLLVSCSDSSSGSETNERVYISNNKRQCEFKGDTPEITAVPLVEAGIDIIGSTCGRYTQRVFCQACGCPTGDINIYTIHSSDLPNAEELGYRSVEKLENSIDRGYTEIECEEK